MGYTLNLEDRTVALEDTTSLEKIGSGRVKIHTDSIDKKLSEKIPWTLTKGWSSEHGELPKGFPSSPWTIQFPDMDVIYISMLDQSTPPATQWYTLNLEDRTVALEDTTSLEIIGSGRVKIHTELYLSDQSPAESIGSAESIDDNLSDQIPWTLTKGWSSENGELPKGFPSSPWTIQFPDMDVIYISMLDKSTPPETQWYTLNLEDGTVAPASTTSLEIIGPGRVKIHTDSIRMKKLRFERFQRLQRFKKTAKLASSVQKFQIRPRDSKKFQR